MEIVFQESHIADMHDKIAEIQQIANELAEAMPAAGMYAREVAFLSNEITELMHDARLDTEGSYGE